MRQLLCFNMHVYRRARSAGSIIQFFTQSLSSPPCFLCCLRSQVNRKGGCSGRGHHTTKYTGKFRLIHAHWFHLIFVLLNTLWYCGTVVLWYLVARPTSGWLLRANSRHSGEAWQRQHLVL